MIFVLKFYHKNSHKKNSETIPKKKNKYNRTIKYFFRIKY